VAQTGFHTQKIWFIVVCLVFRTANNMVAKVITSGGARWVNIPDNVRNLSWPVVQLANAGKFLNI
jgi:hypothetical protein